MAGTLTKLPRALAAAVCAEQESWGWPESFPAYAELVTRGKPTLFQHYDRLTVADCEQLVEQHVRGAWKAFARWRESRSQFTARTFARHVMRARLYRCRFVGLLGKDQADPGDMPFDDDWLAAQQDAAGQPKKDTP